MAEIIIFCEECGQRNLVSAKELKDKDNPVRCIGCKDILRVVRKNEKNPEVIIKKNNKNNDLF